MNNIKKLYVLASSISLIALTIGLISCSTQKQSSQKNDMPNNYDSTRTIPKNENIKILSNNNENLGKYDFNNGPIEYPAVGEFNQETNDYSEIDKQTEQLFTLEEVQSLSNELFNQYTESLKLTSSEYEKYIEELTQEYINLENEYIALVDNISKNTITDDASTNNNTDNKINNKEIVPVPDEENTPVSEQNFNSREEEVDYIYNKALEAISSKLDTFEPIQGQAPESTDEINVDENNKLEHRSLNESDTQEQIPLNAEIIFEAISENVSLPKYINRDSSILTFEYKFLENNFSDFKLVSSENYDNNFFEMLLIKPSTISEEELILKIEDRIDSIITMISENTNEEINLNDKIILINIDDYLLFCFSNINDQILNFLEIV